jgi:hypothetical protein
MLIVVVVPMKMIELTQIEQRRPDLHFSEELYCDCGFLDMTMP